MGLWNLLTGWGKRLDAPASPVVPEPKLARRRQGTRNRKTVSATAEQQGNRICRFEQMEQRQMMDADPIKLGVIYIEEDGGSDLHGDTFEVQFQGGASGTQLSRLVIDGDHGPQGISVGDMIFDTVHSASSLGADQAFAFQIVSISGGGTVSATVQDGSSKLILDFTNFKAGDKLRFSIDVDEIQQYDTSITNLDEINSGVDPIASGVEFQDSLLTGTFQEPHYYDATGTVKFKNLYDPLFAGTNLLISSGNANGLPNDDYQGKRDRSTGALIPLQQTPLPISISGYVYVEHDLDLVRDAGEPALPGVTLTLFKKQGADYVSTGHTTTTDSQGFYKFGENLNLTPGTYQVRETQPASYFSAGAIPGTVNGTVTGNVVAGNKDILTEISIPLGGQHGVHYDFAEYQPASIRGHVHLTNREGDCEEDAVGVTPLAGVQILLKDAAGNIVAQTQTNADGNYAFENILPGTYTVVELTPAGLVDGDEDVGTINGLPVGNVVANDTVGNIVLKGGDAGVHYDFCEHLPATIAGYVYHDANNNGVYDTSETPIPGATVILLDAGGTQIGQLITDQDGFYKFNTLSAGQYSVIEIQPTGWLDGKDAAGTIGGTTVGQAVNPGDKIQNINLLWGDNGVHYDFGELKPASIQGKVYVDPNEDCVFNDGDRHLAGVTVQLLDGSGNLLGTTLTDSTGNYRFDNLTPGTYIVRELQPTGYLQGGQIAGSGGGNDSVQDVISQIAIPSGAALINYDFCEREPVQIAGRVFVDVNFNCLLDPQETSLAGVKIELLNLGGSVVQTTFTASDGTYAFVNLPPGVYSVREIQPTGYFQGGQVAGSHGGDDFSQDLIADVELFSGAHATEYNFCENPPGSISGYVFRDGAPIVTPDGKVPTNLYDIRDGLLTSDDLRIGGVLLELRHSGTADPVTGDEALPGFYGPGPIRVLTDASGYYSFRGLPRGNYTVVEAQPNGYADSRDTPGTLGGLALNTNSSLIPGVIDPFIQAGISLRNDAILRIPLAAGQDSVLNNFSEVQVTTFVIPPPPPPPPSPPPPELPPIPLPPVLSPPPQIFIPPPAPEVILGSGGVAYSWHLSVIDAGLPRSTARGTKINGLAWRPVMFVDSTQWKSERLLGGLWKIEAPQADGTEPSVITFGIEEAIPVTGDWNGDGVAEIGIYYKGEWLLDLNGNRHWDSADLWAKLGDENDLPVVGDWDGDGKDDIGIYGPEWAGDPRHNEYEPGLPDPSNLLKKRPKNVPPNQEEATDGERLLKLTSQGQERADLIDHVFYFGTASDRPIAGDWNGDGISSIGVFREGEWHFDLDGDGRWSKGDELAEFGQEGDLPVVGDFNGDGIDEIGIYRAGKWIIDTNGNREIDAADKVFEMGDSSYMPVVGDFDGDGTDDPALYQEGISGSQTARRE